MMSLNDVAKRAKETLLKTGGHFPTILAHGSRSQAMIIFADFPQGSEKKMKAMFGAGAKLGSEKEMKKRFGILEQVFFISEAWMNMPKKGVKFIQPSKDPKRIESLIIFGMDIALKKQEVMAFEMKRNKKGEFKELKSCERMGKADSVKSPIVEAFVDGYLSSIMLEKVNRTVIAN